MILGPLSGDLWPGLVPRKARKLQEINQKAFGPPSMLAHTDILSTFVLTLKSVTFTSNFGTDMCSAHCGTKSTSFHLPLSSGFSFSYLRFFSSITRCNLSPSCRCSFGVDVSPEFSCCLEKESFPLKVEEYRDSETPISIEPIISLLWLRLFTCM